MAAEVIEKRTGAWRGGKAILLDRRPRGARTEFRHRLPHHALVLHLEGANTRMALRCNGAAEMSIPSTLGQVMLIPADHQLDGWSDFPPRIRHILLLLDPAIIGDEARDDARLAELELPFQPDLADGLLVRLLRALQAELDDPGLLSRLYAKSLSTEIVVRLVRAYSHDGRAQRPARGGLAPRRLRLVKDYVEANLADDITLSDLAAVAGVSATHFCRAFHRSVGMPPHRYIIGQRVERAKAMLAQSDRAIAEIALAAGFGNQSHMTVLFRRFVGTTPRRFRTEA
jgi:AraC family transcriptional regulator